MSQYYNPNRTKNIYTPGMRDPFKISRSKIEFFVECPHCFYLDRRLGVSRPPGYPFNLNSAVDTLFKKEFDVHRAANTQHPLMKHYGVDAVPFQHGMMNEWRENFKGIQFLHKPTNFLVTGAVDDIWINPEKELMVVDYKSTSKDAEVTIDADWQQGYKRQMEIYQWLLRQLEYPVSSTGYFVYANGRTDKEAFDGRLEFTVTLLPYIGNDEWISGVLQDIKTCLNLDTVPPTSDTCDYCRYREAVRECSDKNV
jgi:CRISPR/Cas system-associated exonuclease Cas4 (RecB family)